MMEWYITVIPDSLLAYYSLLTVQGQHPCLYVEGKPRGTASPVQAVTHPGRSRLLGLKTIGIWRW